MCVCVCVCVSQLSTMPTLSLCVANGITLNVKCWFAETATYVSQVLRMLSQASKAGLSYIIVQINGHTDSKSSLSTDFN